MNFYETFVETCKIAHKTPTAVCLDLGINRSAATGWKNGKKPTLRTISAIASYFGVSQQWFLDDSLDYPKNVLIRPSGMSGKSFYLYDTKSQTEELIENSYKLDDEIKRNTIELIDSQLEKKSQKELIEILKFVLSTSSDNGDEQ